MKDTTEATTGEESSSAMKIMLKKVSVLHSSVSYTDKSYNMETYLNNLNFDLSGDMTMSETDLQISATADELTFIMDGMKYLNRVTVDSKIDMLANLDNYEIHIPGKLLYVKRS